MDSNSFREVVLTNLFVCQGQLLASKFTGEVVFDDV